MACALLANDVKSSDDRGNIVFLFKSAIIGECRQFSHVYCCDFAVKESTFMIRNSSHYMMMMMGLCNAMCDIFRILTNVSDISLEFVSLRTRHD